MANKKYRIPTEQEIAKFINEILMRADDKEFVLGTSSTSFEHLDEMKDQAGFRMHYEGLDEINFEIPRHFPGETVAEFDVIIRRVK